MFIYTVFDKSKPIPKILVVAVQDDEGVIDVYPMYVKGNSEQAITTREKARYLRDVITTQQVTINDFKAHILALSLPLDQDYKVKETPTEDLIITKEWAFLESFAKERLANLIMRSDGDKWQELMARATIVYCDLEKRGIIYEGNIDPIHPNYQFKITGRSSTSGFNIQGTGNDTSITHFRPDYDVFISVDWISADLRAASLISGDIELQQSFINSDPYTDLAKINNISRAECKGRVLPGLYSFNLNSDIFRHYKVLKQWAEATIEKMDTQGYLTSMLNRKFYMHGDNEQQLLESRRQVFNAQMQGSVAHAMQNSLVKIHKKYPNCVLTELHDSIILCCKSQMVSQLIKDVTGVMLRPFDGLLENNPVFPLRVSVGSKWKHWKELRVYRV
jgi:hypothetical protein